MSNQKEIVELTHQVRKFAMGKISDISDINRETTFLTASASAAAAKIEANSLLVLFEVGAEMFRVEQVLDARLKHLEEHLR